MKEPSLDFALLEQRVTAYARATAESHLDTAASRYLAIAAAFGVSGVALTALSQGPAMSIAGAVCVFLELAAFLVACVYSLVEAHAALRRPHESFARDLDRNYALFRDLVEWLRSFRRDEIARRLRFMRDRRTSLTFRSGLLSGSTERLGVLPLLAVLYVQFKDWQFGDWKAFGNVHVVGGILLLALLSFYLISWWALRLRMRLDLYEAVLSESLQGSSVEPQDPG